jgi:hypothetical protein
MVWRSWQWTSWWFRVDGGALWLESFVEALDEFDEGVKLVGHF